MKDLYAYSKKIQRRQWQPTLALLPGKSHGWRSLVAAVHGVMKSWTQLNDFTFTFHFHALEKEMATHSSVLAWRIPGWGAWWAAISGIPQSRTWLKLLSSSSSMADSSWGLIEDKEKKYKFRPIFPIPANHHGFIPVSPSLSSLSIYSLIFCIPLYLGNLLTGQDVSSSPIPQAFPHWSWWPIWLKLAESAALNKDAIHFIKQG